MSNYITNKLKSLTSTSDVLGAIENAQFAIALNYSFRDKQILSGSPTKIIYVIEATFQIIDLKGNRNFATYTKDIKGIGNNEQKALINAFQKINSNDENLKKFLREGNNKIIDYYNANYEQIISKARLLASTKHFDEALYNLMTIPECCNGYGLVMEVSSTIYQQFIDQHCNENLAQARAAWIASPNRDGAMSASIFISEIYPDAGCYEDAIHLANEIKKQMGEEWKFAMKQWDDNISLERQRIEAMREIGISFAKSKTNSHK
ncbi:MAG: hypothetical protein NC342_00450 [Pseudoflavonifractor sp.]|nr:hypothetical protein [Alloprevotella sp.]MCM1115996.1 hypothetical protein [Pseudoflavonifractor sp.]